MPTREPARSATRSPISQIARWRAALGGLSSFLPSERRGLGAGNLPIAGLLADIVGLLGELRRSGPPGPQLLYEGSIEVDGLLACLADE
jgi:hypothetical protein